MGVTVYYLEMLEPDHLVPTSRSIPAIRLEEVSPADGGLNQRFYREVGEAWSWIDRSSWPLDRWRAHVAQDEITTIVFREAHAEIGYAELRKEGEEVEIVYFGLLPNCVGRGLGGAALAAVVRWAWALPETRRVWLHTCSDDHPNALKNYRRRGFRLYDEERLS